MITLNLNARTVEGEISSLMKAYAELPRHIAKKHLQASMKRALRDGIPVLKRNTPVGRVMRANRKGVVKMRRSGELRKAATAVAKSARAKGKSGYVVGTLGFKYGDQSRKAIWLEFGTKTGTEAVRMVEKSMAQMRSGVAKKLAAEMAIALERAASELASGKNPGYQGGK